MAFCDHVSVGVIIEGSSDPSYAGQDGTRLMFRRVKPPYGIAPVAGHGDDFADIRTAMRCEAEEESGLRINDIHDMIVDGEWRDNACRRDCSGPTGHKWWVGRTTAHGQLLENPQETKDLRWYAVGEIEDLAWRTNEHALGRIGYHDFHREPGIEPVWVEWLIEADILRPDGLDLEAIDRLAQRIPVPIEQETRP